MRITTPNLKRVFIAFLLFTFSFATSTFAQQFDVAITKTTVTSAPVKYGTPIPFNITIYNQGTDTIMNVEVIDHFGSGYEYQQALNPTWNPHPTIVNAVNTLLTDKIAPGENTIITINLIAQPGDERADWFNTAEVVDFTDRFGASQEAADTDSQGDEIPNNDAGGLLGSPADDFINGDGTGTPDDGVAATDEDDHDRDTVQIFDLALKKVLDPITGYKYGDTLTFTTTVYNQGNIVNRQIRVRDIIPEGYINPIAENVALGWSNNAANPIYTIDVLNPMDSISFDLKLILSTTMSDGDAWINFVEVISARNASLAPLSADLDADSQMASNTDGERSVAQGDPDDNYIGNNSVNPGDEDDHDPAEPVVFDLALIKERSTALSSFNYGEPIAYEITVVNQGNVAATDIVLVDSLPCGAMFEQALNPGWAYDATTNLATFTVSSLTPRTSTNTDHIFVGELILTVIGCVEDQETAWTNYLEIAQATTSDGVQFVEIDGVFDTNFANDPGGIPLTDSDNNLDGIGIEDEDNHDVELLQVYDLALKKELITQGPYTEGQDLDFRIRVYNQGNIVIEDLIVEDFIPEGFGYDPAVNAPFGWTTSYSTVVGGTPTTFPDTLNVMEGIFLDTEDSVDITIRLTLELDGQDISDWYNYAHIWVATDTIGNSRFDDADSNPFTPTAAEFAVIPDSPNDNNIFSPGKSAMPAVEEDDHDVANVSFFDLALTKTATSTPTAYGQDVTFDIVVKNEGVQFAHDITVVDYLPCGLTFTSSAGWAVNGITGNPEYFYTDTLFAGEEVIIPITLTVEECTNINADSYRNEAEIVNALNDDDVTGDDQDSTPDNQVPGEDDTDDALISVFDLSLTKTVSSPPANFAVGTPVSYNIVITNEGNVPAVNAEITDYLPCGLDFSPTGNTGWTQDAITGNISYVEMSQIDPGTSITIPLTLTIGACTNEPYDLTNLVEVSNDDLGGTVDDFDSTPDNGDPDEDDIDTATLAFFDLSLTKTLTTNVAILTYGMNLNYTIEVTNEGSIPATSFTVTDEIPCGLSFSSVGNAGWTLDSNSGNASFEYTSTLNPGESAQLILTLVLEECATPTTDSWNNVAEISEANDPNGPATDEDSTPNNQDPNEDDIDSAPLEVGDLAISKTHIDPVGPIGIGTPIDYTITVSNQGNVAMTDFTITDYIPCGLEFSTAGNSGWTTNAMTGNPEYNVNSTIQPGGTLDIPLTLTVGNCLPPLSPDYNNIVEISDQGPNPNDPDSNPDNDPNNDLPGEDDIDEDPLEFYDLSLVKSSTSMGNSKYGDVIDYTITIINEGSLSATNVEVTDYLPCGLRFDQGLNTGWTFNTGTGNASTTYVGTIDPGSTHDFTLRLILEECNGDMNTAYNNIAEITGGVDPSGNPGDDEDSTPGNQDPNEDDIDDQPLDVFDLSLVKSVTSTQSEYELGQDVTYNIEVINEGNVEAIDVVITDYIPCGMTLSIANTLLWGVDANGYASLTIDPIAVNQSVNIPIILTIGNCALETGQRRNVAEITGNGSDNPIDADSTPGNEDPNEDDIDDVIIEVNVGSTIGDYVWNDIDADGIQDSNENGIQGVTVILYTPEGDIVEETITNGAGFYEFTEVEEGDYYIGFTDLSEDFEPTTPFSGNDTNDSNVTDDNGPNTTSIFSTVPGEDDNSIDAGFFVCSLIKGVSYYDINEDDIRQSTENGINGLVVNLYRRVDGVWTLWDSETTHHDYDTPSDDGIWDFCVAPGQYYIEVEMPPIGLVRVRPFVGGSNFDSDINGSNGPGTTPTFTLSPGGSKTDLGAGYYPMATVGNRVWHDQNYNGIQEDTEPILANVTVQVYDMEHNLVDETTTNEEGVYKVEYLQKQEYYLKFEAPDGFGFTFADATTDEIDSDVNHAMGLNTTSPRMYNPGEDVDFVDAGLVNGVLPVTWNEIGVERESDHHLVHWGTAQELNVEIYRIERKLESEEEFTPIGRLDAFGNSTLEQNYQFTDFDIKSEGKYYYRIQQVDFDGMSSYSDIVYTTNYTDAEYIVFPNPTVDKLTVKGSYTEGKVYNVKLVSMTGQSIIKFNTVPENNEILIDLSNITTGMYYLEIFDESNQKVTKKKVFKN